MPLKEVLRLDSASVQGLLAAEPAQIKQLLGLGMSLGPLAKLTPTQRDSLLAANPDVVKGLLGAGMSVADVAAYASTIKPDEIKAPEFLQLLRDKLAAGTPAAEAIVWARFTPLASSEQLNDPQFIQDLLSAPTKGYGDSPTSCLFYARASLLARRLGNTASVDESLKLDGATINKLLALDPAQIQQFMGMGMSLTQFAQLSDEQRAALLAANPDVVKGLLGAGMSLAEVAAYASTITPDEIKAPEFLQLLRDKLAAGTPAAEAIVWARFTPLASPEELNDPQFIQDLLNAPANGYGDSPTNSLSYARANLLDRRLGDTVSVSVDEILKLDGATINKLLALDPTQIQQFMGMGMSLTQFAQLSDEQCAALLAADPVLVTALLGAGMSAVDVATCAGTVVTPSEATPEFIESVRQRISEGASGPAAIAGARYGDLISGAELANPDFIRSLLFPAESGIPPSQGALATTLTASLGYARDHVDIFEAAEKVANSLGNPHNGWFANDGVFKLAGMSAESAEWAQIEATLERPLSGDERVAAISSAKGMADNWSTLCAMAGPLNLHLREGTSDVLDFTSENLRELNFSPLIAMLGNSPASLGSQSMNIVSALDYLRQHIDLFEAAEQVANSSGDSQNGWFANAGVFTLAGLPADSLQWDLIERTLGRQISFEDRATAIAAAKGVSENWGTLCANAGAIGLSLRDGTTDTIDFKADNLSQLNFAPLALLPSQSQAIDRLNTLHYARAQTIVKHLSDPQGNPAQGADLQTVLSLNLSAAQASNLLSPDPEAARTLLSSGAPLDQLAAIAPADLPAVQKVDPTLLQWLLQVVGATLSEISKLTDPELQSLDAARLAGFRPTAQNEVFNDIKPETVSHPISLGSGVLSLETQSGQKIIVFKDTNPSLYSQALGLLTDRSQTQIKETRAQFGLPPEAEVNVMELPTNVPINPDNASDGNLAVGPNTLQVLLDRYRGYILQPGQATVENNLVTYRLADGSELKVDKNNLKTDRSKAIFDNFIAGKAVSEAELKYLESDEGSADIFEGDDRDTWIKFTQTIPKDDPRAQLVRALDARGALANGYSLLPYFEAVGDHGNTLRSYPGGEINPTYQTATPADMRSMLNEGAVNNRVMSLMANESIQADYQAAVNESVNTLPNKQELSDKLYNALTGSQYIHTLRALKDKDLSYEAQQMTQRDLAQLALLDPARATDAAQQLRLNSLSADFQDLTDDPSKIDNPTFETATTDALTTLATLIRGMAAGGRHVAQSAMDALKLFEETLKDKKSVAELSKVLRELVIEAKAGVGGPIDLKGITQAQFDLAMSKTYVPLEMRGKLTGFFTKAQKFGAWGTLAGAASVASFGYQISKGAWSANSTPMERWGAARDLISFVSVGKHLAATGAGAADFLLKQLLGTDGESQGVWKALGLDRTLPELWGRQSFLPSQPAVPDPLKQPLLADDAFSRSASDLWNEYDNPSERAAKLPEGTTSVPERAGGQALDAADHLGDMWATRSELKPLGNVASRVGLSAFKVLATVTDLVGVADIVMGALGLKDAIKEGDGGMIAANTLNILGGAALTGAGAIGTAGLFAALPAVIAAASAPLFLVGTVLAMGGFIVSMIVGSEKRHNELQRNSDEQGQWLSELADDGLANSDWADKLEYLRYSYAWYGNDNTDPNKSQFEFQQAEWDYFHNTAQQGGSSANRLNNDLHVRTDKTWEPPDLSEYVQDGLS